MLSRPFVHTESTSPKTLFILSFSISMAILIAWKQQIGPLCEALRVLRTNSCCKIAEIRKDCARVSVSACEEEMRPAGATD